MTSTHYAQGNWPVYCFSISGAPAKNIVATPENTTQLVGSVIGFLTVALNASVDAAQVTTWGCGSGTDAAVLSMQTPESALYVAFQR
jgi:hypothetical protein